ncbi:MAG TPA: CsgG/HfaB family protein [Nitrospiraceae bacterium]|nr:CsgG/HfaB family protein [Nitrospiraceae bacterium]
MSSSLLLAHCTGSSVTAPDRSLIRSASQASKQAQFPSPLVVSVLHFEDRSHLPELAWLRKGMTDMLVATLTRNPALMVVQRERLEEVMREQALQVSGRVADESTVHVGRLTGATLLVTGSISVVEGRLRLDAQLSGVEQGVVLGTAMAEGPVAEVPSITGSLLTKVMELLPGSAQHATPDGNSAWSSAKANQAGETLSRAGKMFLALEEFERAIASNPYDPAPQSNYTKTMRTLSDAELIDVKKLEAAGPRERVADRIVERLVTRGLEADIGPSRAEAQADGSVTLHVPVRFRLASEAVTAAVESIRALGGRVDTMQDNDGLIEMAWPSSTRDLVQAVGYPRRIFLRLLSADGRTIAAYSDFLEWRLSTWLTPIDGERVRLASRKVVSSEGTIAGLLPEQVAAVAAVTLTVDRVPNEQTAVRVDLSDLSMVNERERGLGSIPPQTGLDSDRVPGDGGASLRAAIEHQWNPPVMERPWGRGYLPGNERTAAVLLLLAEDGKAVPDEARLARRSGDVEFDKACLQATRAGVQRWRDELADGWPHWFDTAVHAVQETREPARPRILKARIHFRLRKDVPGLNLIGAQEQLAPLRPLMSGHSSP